MLLQRTFTIFFHSSFPLLFHSLPRPPPLNEAIYVTVELQCDKQMLYQIYITWSNMLRVLVCVFVRVKTWLLVPKKRQVWSKQLLLDQKAGFQSAMKRQTEQVVIRVGTD